MEMEMEIIIDYLHQGSYVIPGVCLSVCWFVC